MQINYAIMTTNRKFIYFKNFHVNINDKISFIFSRSLKTINKEKLTFENFRVQRSTK